MRIHASACAGLAYARIGSVVLRAAVADAYHVAFTSPALSVGTCVPWVAALRAATAAGLSRDEE